MLFQKTESNLFIALDHFIMRDNQKTWRFDLLEL
jgi:hypothetical protein